MFKRFRVCFILILFISAFVSCRSIHDVAYISDAERDSAQRILTTYTNTIHPGDQLYIYVNSLNPQSVAPFNQEMHSVVAEANRMASIRGESSKQQNASIFDQHSVRQVPGYMVDEAGTIIFPLLGKLHVEGITQDSLSHLIQQRLNVRHRYFHLKSSLPGGRARSCGQKREQRQNRYNSSHVSSLPRAPAQSAVPEGTAPSVRSYSGRSGSCFRLSFWGRSGGFPPPRPACSWCRYGYGGCRWREGR